MNSDNSCCSIERSAVEQNHKVRMKNIKGCKSKKKDQDNMLFIQGGSYLMGTNDKSGFPEDKEGPIKNVEVSSFLIDKYVVTNADFNDFVKDTGYTTDAEKFGWSFVFHIFLPKRLQKTNKVMKNTQWWYAVEGAYWLRPEGPGSSIDGRENHPVVHISWSDTMAYCDWLGKRLPTEIEWEYAARGGLVQKKYPWGDELSPDGEHCCNIWQGEFPNNNTQEDGFLGTSPVNSFSPNNFGLYNVSGNVWEWCQNNFQNKFDVPSDNNEQQVHPQTYKAIRGGSYLCHKSYCNRYRVAARSANTIESSSGNMGFRCALSIK